VTPDVLRTLLAWVEVLRPALTRPGYANALVVFSGWVLTQGRHAITEALVVTDVARRRHHERFHRFFSRGTWSPDAIGRLLFERIVAWLPAGTALDFVLDDTLTPKKGPKVFGLGCHLDAVRSTRRVRVFCFGHVWVVLSVVIRFPFARRAWAVPVLFRLYRNEKECLRKRTPYRKKTELGRELVDLAAAWAGPRAVRLSVDSAYCNHTLLRGLATTVTVFGAIRPDAALTALPTAAERRATGRRRVCGKALPKPEQLAHNTRIPWTRIPWLRCRAHLYGRQQVVQYKTLDAQWYRGAGTSLVRIVVVRVLGGTLDLRVFLCTDSSQSVPMILETYAGRWATEVLFRNLKQQLGFGDSSARKQAAVERTAPFVGYIYTTLVLWFVESAVGDPVATPPIRPWYKHKRGFTFADVLRAAQRTLAPLDVLDPARSVADLQKTDGAAPARHRARRKAPSSGARAPRRAAA
jgi:hypothetical protein